MRFLAAATVALSLSACQALVGISDLREQADAGPDAAPTSKWTVRNSHPTYRDVIYAQSKFVAVGAYGTIETSTDGVTWTPHSCAETYDFQTLVFTNSKWFALTGRGEDCISSDGNSWSKNIIRPGYGLIAMAYGAGKYVGYDGGQFLTSLDGVTQWTSVGFDGDGIQRMYYANSTFVAPGDNFLHTSSNGVTWSTQPFNATNPSDPAHNAVYAAGKWVVVGEHSSAVATGTTFTNTPYSGLCCQYGVTYSGTNFFSVGGTTLARSTDGVNWGSVVNLAGENNRGIAYGAGHFVTAGETRSYSSDGSTWTLNRADSGAALNWVATSDGALPTQFIAVGNWGKVFTTTDGVTWTKRASIAGGPQLSKVTFGGGQFVASNCSNTMYSTTDGVTWTPHTSPSGCPSGVTYGGGTWVFGDGGSLFWSTDLNTWTSTQATGTCIAQEAGAYGNATFVIGGCNGKVFYSSDGKVWNVVTTAAQTMNYMIYANGRFVARDRNLIWTSVNGRDWTSSMVNVANTQPDAIGYDGTRYVYYHNGGYGMYSSADLAVWQREGLPVNAGWLKAFVYAPTLHRAVAVGEQETIVTTP